MYFVKKRGAIDIVAKLVDIFIDIFIVIFLISFIF